jgi:predicted site-specific integrase-resolvase
VTLNISEAAQQVGVSEATIRSWVMRGYLEPVRRGAKPLRFAEYELVACARERMSKAEHDALDALWAELLAR